MALTTMDSSVQLWLKRIVDAPLDHQAKITPPRGQIRSDSRSSRGPVPLHSRSSSTRTRTTVSAARSDYQLTILSIVYRATFALAREAPEQLPRELAIALGALRNAPLPPATSEGGQQNLAATQDASTQSIGQLSGKIDILVCSPEASAALESWWNISVWGAVYTEVMLTQRDLMVVCVRRLEASQRRAID